MTAGRGIESGFRQLSRIGWPARDHSGLDEFAGHAQTGVLGIRDLKATSCFMSQGPEASWAWHIVSGEVNGQRGPVASQTGLFMSSELRPGATFETAISTSRGVMLYVVRGTRSMACLTTRTMVELSHDSGSQIHLTAWDDEALVLLCHGDVLVTCRGPWTVRDEHGSGNRSLHRISVGPVWPGRGLTERQGAHFACAVVADAGVDLPLDFITNGP